MIDAKLRDGSLRKAAQDKGIDVLLYEAGEGLRFDEVSARWSCRNPAGDAEWK